MRAALFIGLNQYTASGLENLKRAAADAQALYQRFFRSRDDWDSLYVCPEGSSQGKEPVGVDPTKRVTKQELEKKIKRLITPDDRSKPSTILLYFSGHAFAETSLGEDRVSDIYLCAGDDAKAVKLRDLLEGLDKSEAGEILVWLDCCHSGTLIGFEGQFQDKEGRLFLAASGSRESALEGQQHGLFTKQLLESLDELARRYSEVYSQDLVANLSRRLHGYPQSFCSRNTGKNINLLRGIVPSDGPVQSNPAAEAVYRGYLRRLQADWQRRFTFSDSKPDASVRSLPIEDVFLELSLHEDATDTRGDPSKRAPTRSESAQTDTLALLSKPEYRLTILKGDLGSGKTTLTAFIACRVAEARLRGGSSGTVYPDRCWPVRVALRDAVSISDLERSEETIWSLVEQTVLSGTGSVSGGIGVHWPWLRERLTEEGLFLFDGLDELSAEQRTRLVEAIGCFTRAIDPTARALITTRPYALFALADQTGLADFRTLELEPLHPQQIERHIDRWYKIIQGRDHWDDDERDRITRELKRRLRDPGDLRDLARTPLLLNLLLALHGGRTQLPEDRASVFEAAVKLLLTRFDRPLAEDDTGDEAPGLARYIREHMTAIRKRIQAVAFDLHKAQGAIAGDRRGGTSGPHYGLSKQDLLGIFALDETLDVLPRYLFQYLEKRAGLLVPGENGLFEFPSRSFCEYLAACHLLDKYPRKKIIKLIQSDRNLWREVFLFTVGKLAQASQMNDAIELVKRLLGTASSQTPVSIDGHRDVVLAAQALLELRIPKCDPDNSLYPQLKHDICKRLHSLIRGCGLPPSERAEAGDHLGRLGDPRDGVGCQDGLPKISWQRVSVLEMPMTQGMDSYWVRFRKPFSIARYLVTVDQYRTFIEDGAYAQPAHWGERGRRWLKGEGRTCPTDWDEQVRYPNRPVAGVSWYEAMAFCRWLSHKTKEAIRLPTEWEWEFAVRDNGTNPFPWSNDSDRPGECANTAEGAIGHATAVGLYPEGAVRDVYDLAGNCCEWCCNLSENPLNRLLPQDCGDIEQGGFRAVRGGSWWRQIREASASHRNGFTPSAADPDFGFRLVREEVT